MAETVKIEGLKKLSRELKAIDTNLPKELKEVSKVGAEMVATTARTIVPVQSGKLQSKIKASATNAGAYAKIGGTAYHKVQHFGWAGHNIAPKPFMYEALDARRDEVIAAFEKGVADLIAKSITPGTGGE